MGKAYSNRRIEMKRAIAKYGLEIASGSQSGGSSFWMRAPDHVDTKDLALRLHKHGVVIEPGHVFFVNPDAPRNFYRLAYSSIPVKRMEKGIELIAQEIALSGPIQA